jgi:hypothetical protein
MLRHVYAVSCASNVMRSRSGECATGSAGGANAIARVQRPTWISKLLSPVAPASRARDNIVITSSVPFCPSGNGTTASRAFGSAGAVLHTLGCQPGASPPLLAHPLTIATHTTSNCVLDRRITCRMRDLSTCQLTLYRDRATVDCDVSRSRRDRADARAGGRRQRR